MSILEAAEKAFPDGVTADMSEQYTEIRDCKNIYKNDPPWKEVKKSGLSSNGKRKMALLNAAKVLSDEFAALTFSEQVDITINDVKAQKYVDDVLNKNGFWKNIPDFLSVAYAIGGGVLKVYADNKQPCIDFVDGDNFVPMAWNGQGIFEGAFQSVTVKGKYYYTLIERHFIKKSMPCVENKLYISNTDSEIGEGIDLDALYDDLIPLVEYKDIKDVRMFQYFKPAVSNNVDTDSPLGLSVFSNAKDTLKALDIAFDSFSREFILGKKRIIVPNGAIKTVIDPDTGTASRYFDADDEAYVAMKCDDDKELKITDNTTILRIEEHVSAINALLNILCFQTGLSSGTLSFSAGEGVKTATEVVSRDSKTARTIKNNKNLLTETFEGLVRSILALGIWYKDIDNKDYEVTVAWQDNIIIDDNTLIDNNVKLVSAGLKSKLKAIMDVQKCDKKTAQEELDRINKESQVTGAEVDLFGTDGGKADKADEDMEGEEVPDTADVVDSAEEVAGKSLNGAQTQSLISIITQYQAGSLTIGQAVNVISVAIGVSKEEAKKIIEGAE